MRVAIVGTRTFNNDMMFREYMEKYVSENDTIVTGDADGADHMARIWAAEHKMPLMVFPANWKLHGIKAGPMRNQQIVDASDKMVAFWNGLSRGTANSIDNAQRRGIHLIVARY